MTNLKFPQGFAAIKPKDVWLQCRAADLAGTISRYLNSGTLTPMLVEWITELNEIVAQMSNKIETKATAKIASDSLGIRVIMRFSPDSEFCKNGITERIHRNVTELNCVNQESGIDSFSARILLSSKIHNTGCSYKLSDVIYYRIVTETEKADNF